MGETEPRQRSDTDIEATAVGAAIPITISGLACRLPGATTVDRFWDLLIGGVDAIADPPAWRGPRRPGGYLSDVECFEPRFFGVSGHEAAAMDPQQRILLETVWHAMHDAHVDATALAAVTTGVFVGASNEDYAHLVRRDGAVDSYTLTGTSRTFLANRVSHILGLSGPSMVVDTGQSSSLTALHTAVTCLRSGDCDVAVVAGVHLNLDPQTDDVLDSLGVLSPTHRCRTLDSTADGIVRGEGVGVVILTTGAHQHLFGRAPYASVVATAVGHDAAAGSLTTSSSQAQARLLDAVYAETVHPDQLGYLELHGTGTRVGDPIEIDAVTAVLGSARTAADPLWVGSVKTNIGHLEAAAGIAGVIKVALSIQHGQIPPNLHFHRSAPAIDLPGSGLDVPITVQPWRGRPSERYGAVTSLGLGGSNAHVVLAGCDPVEHTASAVFPAPLLVSGSDHATLRVQAGRLRAHLAACDPTTVAARAWQTLRDPHGPVRIGSAVRDRADALLQLSSLAAGDLPADTVIERPAPGEVVFTFPGQGMQKPGMSTALYRAYPAFAEAFDKTADILNGLVERDIVDLLWQDADLDRLDYAQPLLFAIQTGLLGLLASFGITPDIVLGHSQGEITAAYAAGVLSLEDACLLVRDRGRLIDSLPPTGAMLATMASVDQVNKILPTFPTIDIAGMNGPSNTVLAGPSADLPAMAEEFRLRGIHTRTLRVARAGHCSLMRPISDELATAASRVAWMRPPQGAPRLISCLDGAEVAVDAVDTFDWPGHWAWHLCRPVRYADAVDRAHLLGGRWFVEVGPGHSLTTMTTDCLDGEVLATPLMDGDREVDAFVTAIAQAAAGGYRLNPHPATMHTDVPHYEFARNRYWYKGFDPGRADPTISAGVVTPPIRATVDPALGSAEKNSPPITELVEDLVNAAISGDITSADLDRSFTDIGLDSRAAVALRTALNRRLGRQLPRTLLFDYPSPRSLVDYLISETDT
ncbi:type I polyketide synthase [Nocardia alba]|uniref:Acyl transferase domain-containing protein n=1 Tax=Nocardia alba TaxID=225051 RepID=A0A4R1F8G5_9NOCA|nr:type I polyketide synthase [Nocardia alba]TCJ89890.1 acyl transferase domain-containing protein [Nocardia alba]